jgi:hypothetical protein
MTPQGPMTQIGQKYPPPEAAQITTVIRLDVNHG